MTEIQTVRATITFEELSEVGYNCMAYKLRDFVYLLTSKERDLLGNETPFGYVEAYEGTQKATITVETTRDVMTDLFSNWYTTDEATVRAAANIEERRYYQRVQDAADDIKERIAAGEFDDADGDDLTEAIDSECEVIYYADAYTILRFCENSDAYRDRIGDDPDNDCIKASFALEEDVRDRLGDLEDLFNELAPLTDAEKTDAYERYTEWDAENAGEETPDQEAQRDACWEIGEEMSDNSDRAERIGRYLINVLDGEESAPTP